MTKLSKVLKLVYETDRDIVTSKEFLNLGLKASEISRIFSLLVRDRVLYKIENGVYSKKPLNELDIFYLAQTIFHGYIGFTTACYIYGWLEYLPFSIYIISGSTSGEKKIGAFLIKSVSLKNKAVGSVSVKNYITSSPGKTIFDIFYKPELAGGYKEVLKIVKRAELKNSDWKEFLKFSKKFGSKSFLQRTGYLLSKIGIEIDELMPEKPVVTKIKGVKKCRFDKKWNVIDYSGGDYD